MSSIKDLRNRVTRLEKICDLLLQGVATQEQINTIVGGRIYSHQETIMHHDKVLDKMAGHVQFALPPMIPLPPILPEVVLDKATIDKKMGQPLQTELDKTNTKHSKTLLPTESDEQSNS